jgi:hypothetical protein
MLAHGDPATVVLDLDDSTTPSACTVTRILVAWPAIASSIELSTTSQTR